MGNAIFLSYRRSDSAASARRLVDDLGDSFGRERILVDLEMPEPGRSFTDLIDQTLRACSAVVVVIGPAFLQRLRDPADFVRQEIERALASGLPVLPVLVDDARMPALADLPESLAGLDYRQAVQLSHRGWRQGVVQLTQALLRVAAEPAPPRPAPAPAPARPPPPVAPPAAVRDIFISYAFEDEAWAQRVVATLEAQGYACWIASRDIVPGSPSYAREITRAIKSVRLLVVVLSAATNGSDDVLGEITLAKNNGVPRLPLRIDASAMDEGLEYFFSQAQRLESATQDAAELLQRLARAVAQQLGAPRPAG